MIEPAMRVRGLDKAFGERQVLRGVDLDLAPAENLVVLGRSGSGKSVLIKILIGLLEPDAGTVELLGQAVHPIDAGALDRLRRRVGFAFQGGALYDSMTVAENIGFPLSVGGRDLPREDIRDKVAAAIDAVGLAGKGNDMPAELSGGQRKRVGIARALILDPAVMFYDEPTAGLDPITSAEINELILDVQRVHRTASIIITHDLACARATGERVAMLLDGSIQRQGSFDEVFASDDPGIRKFYDYNFTSPRHP